MKCYFIVTTYVNKEDRGLYDDYIQEVKPIVEKYGGKYLVRTENIVHLSENWRPDRVIVIEFPSKEQLETCFSSDQYQKIKSKRENSVKSMAIIVNGINLNEVS